MIIRLEIIILCIVLYEVNICKCTTLRKTFIEPKIVGGYKVENRADFPYQCGFDCTNLENLREMTDKKTISATFCSLPIPDNEEFFYQENDEKNLICLSFKVSIRHNGKHFCGGSILDKENVLTAAHCCFQRGVIIPSKELTIVAGDLNLQKPTNTTLQKNVKYVFTHPEFSLNTVSNDIALMRIEGSFEPWSPEIRPINHSKSAFIPGTPCNISGWGKINEGDAVVSDDLYAAMVPVIDTQVCKHSYKKYPITSGMFCAGYLKGEVDACKGDSGGPLVCNKELTGIVSWGSGCATPNSPGVYTNVPKYFNWIANEKLRSSSNKTRLVSILIILPIMLVFLSPLYAINL